MKLKLPVWTGLFIGGIASAHAAGRLQATLLQADSGNPTKVVLTLTNTGDKSLSFERYTTPLVLLDGEHTSFRQFDVEDAQSSDHKPAEYRGYFIHTVGHTPDNYMTLAPGQSETAHYDLASDFKMAPGKTYNVTFHMTLGQTPEDANGIAIPNDLRVGPTEDISSNTVLISVPTTSIVKERVVVAVAANPPVTD